MLQSYVFGLIYPAPNFYKPTDEAFVKLHAEFYAHVIDGIHSFNLKCELKDNTIDVAYVTNTSIPYNNNRKHLIILGGNGSCYERTTPLTHHFARKNYNVVTFNPMGVGNSTGQTKCPADYALCLEAVINDLIAHGIPEKNIILYGHSFGAAIATIVAEKFQTDNKRIRVINDRSFAELAPLAAHLVKNAIPHKGLRFIFGQLVYYFVYFIIKLLDLNIKPAQSFEMINIKNPGDAICIIADDDEMIPNSICIDKNIQPAFAKYCHIFYRSTENSHHAELNELKSRTNTNIGFTAAIFLNQSLLKFSAEENSNSHSLVEPTAISEDQTNLVLLFFNSFITRWTRLITTEPEIPRSLENDINSRLLL